MFNIGFVETQSNGLLFCNYPTLNSIYLLNARMQLALYQEVLHRVIDLLLELIGYLDCFVLQGD